MNRFLIIPGGSAASRIIFLFGILMTVSMSVQAASGPDPAAEEAPALIGQADRYFEKIHEDMSGLGKAIRLLEQVIEKDPDHLEARWKLAELLFISAMAVRGKSSEKMLYEQSLSHAERALASDPLCVPALFYCGCARVSLARLVGTFSVLSLLKNGKKELAGAMASAPADRFGVLAACVLSQVNTDTPWPMRDLSAAEKFARQAVTWDPDLTMAGAQLAIVYWHQEKYDAARAEARRCLDIVKPTYLSDAVLWDWPAARDILEKVREKTGK